MSEEEFGLLAQFLLVRDSRSVQQIERRTASSLQPVKGENEFKPYLQNEIIVPLKGPFKSYDKKRGFPAHVSRNPSSPLISRFIYIIRDFLTVSGRGFFFRVLLGKKTLLVDQPFQVVSN